MSATRWSPNRLHLLPQWIRNDVPKYASKPGLVATAERAILAADLLDAVIATHVACDVGVCPTMQAMYRVLGVEQ